MEQAANALSSSESFVSHAKREKGTRALSEQRKSQRSEYFTAYFNAIHFPFVGEWEKETCVRLTPCVRRTCTEHNCCFCWLKAICSREIGRYTVHTCNCSFRVYLFYFWMPSPSSLVLNSYVIYFLPFQFFPIQTWHCALVTYGCAVIS